MKRTKLSFKPFTTRRLVMDRLTHLDSEEFHRITKLVFPCFNIQEVPNKNDITEWIKNMNYVDELIWAVRLKSTGKLIGWINSTVNANKNYKRAELGYVFDPSYHKNGYGFEATKELLKIVFESGIESVIFKTREDNQDSIKLAKKLGGKLSWIQKGDILFEGCYVDQHVYLINKYN